MKKKLQEYANKELEQLKNEEFLNSLKAKQNVHENDVGNKRIYKIMLSSGISVLCLAIILLCVFLIKPAQTPVADNTKLYLEENISSSEIDVSLLNNDLKVVSFANDIDFNDVRVYRDAKYDETLYYYVSYVSEDELVRVNFTILTNKDYKIDFLHKDFDRSISISGHELDYAESYTVDEDLYFFKSKGELISDQEIIYIEAEIIGFEENSYFEEVVETIIRGK